MPGSLWHTPGGEALSTVRPVVASMHRRVPPTAVTRGSEAGHSTLGYGISRGLLVGSLRLLLVPPSPEDASTVMWLACASTSARRRFDNEAVPANVPSPAPRLMLMTSARWLGTMYSTAFIICGKPCTPRLSAAR